MLGRHPAFALQKQLAGSIMARCLELGERRWVGIVTMSAKKKVELTMGNVKNAWYRIEKWYKANAPVAELTLSPGASDKALKGAETELGLSFPKDVRESYRLHDGTDQHAVLPFGFHLLSLNEIVKTWKMWRDHLEQGIFDNAPSSPDGPIKKVWWNLKWVPLTHNSGGDHQCIDMEPEKRGQIGQVINFSHEVGPLNVLAPSFQVWLLRFAKDLELGKYRFDEDELCLFPVEE
jgi:cell wall assembly regulator SMI1